MILTVLAPGQFLVWAPAAFAEPKGTFRKEDPPATQAQEILRMRCWSCHGESSKPKMDLDILNHGLLLDRKLVVPHQPDSSELLELIRVGSMPPGKRSKLGSKEIQALHAWVKQGALPFPPQVGEDYILSCIEQDVDSLRRTDPELPGNSIYISFNHYLPLREKLAKDLDKNPTVLRKDIWRQALSRALNQVSRKANLLSGSSLPVAIDSTHTIFRIDIRKLGWDEEPFEILKPDERLDRTQPSPVNLYDLVLLEYPFATIPDLADAKQKWLRDYLTRANLVRPIAYVRGDWLIQTILRSPLYEDLLNLPYSVKGLEDQLAQRKAREKDSLQGKDCWAGYWPNTREEDSPQAGKGGYWHGTTKQSKHSARPPRARLLTRQPAAQGYWVSWDLPARTDTSESENLAELARRALGIEKEVAPHLVTGRLQAPGQILFPLPNGLNAYFQFDRLGQRRGSFAPQELAELEAGLSCILCHQKGVQPLPNAAAARQAIGNTSWPTTEKTRLQEWFATQATLDQLVKVDQTRHAQALKRIHGGSERLAARSVTPLEMVELLYRSWAPPRGQLTPVSASLQQEKTRLREYITRTRSGGSGGPRKGPTPEPGPPILPIDALTYPSFTTHPPGAKASPATDAEESLVVQALKVNKGKVEEATSQANRPTPTSVFQVGDRLMIEIKNTGNTVLSFELIQRNHNGQTTLLVPPTALKEGETFRYPALQKGKRPESSGPPQDSGPIREAGTWWYTVLASNKPLPEAIRLQRATSEHVKRGAGQHVGERIIHRIYGYSKDRKKIEITPNTVSWIKKTVVVRAKLREN